MAQRTIKNIEKESYPLMGKLIKAFPELFKHTEMIGIFEGVDICASFLLNSDYCETITFYENFNFTKNEKVKKKFCDLYKSWEESIPNLKIIIEDGNNFAGNSNFVLIDTTTGLDIFVKEHFKKLRKSWAVSPGYGQSFICTKNMFTLINNRTIFPILIYRDYFFYCFNRKTQKKIVNKINNFARLNFHVVEQTDDNIKFLELLEYKECDSSYFNRLEEINSGKF